MMARICPVLSPSCKASFASPVAVGEPAPEEEEEEEEPWLRRLVDLVCDDGPEPAGAAPELCGNRALIAWDGTLRRPRTSS